MLIEEVSGYLSANGHPGAGLGSLPSTPDDAYALWEYGSQPPQHVKQQQDAVLEKPRFQVITRSKSYALGRLKAERIYRLLDGYSGVIDGVVYESISALESPYHMDRDELGRARFIFRCEATKEQSPLV